MPALLPIVLLCISNVFMTFAWYGHLKFKSASLFTVIVVSWGIAFIEYCFAVPATRLGHVTYRAPPLKPPPEIITLAVFAAFSALYLREPLGWRQLVGFGFVALGGFFVFDKG